MDELLNPNQEQQAQPASPNAGQGGQLSKKQLRRQARLERKAEEQTTRTIKRTGKRVVLWTSVIVIFALIVWGFIKLAGQSTPTGVTNGTITVDAVDHMKGNTSSTVTLVEYSDFQCPACGAYYPMVEQIAKEFASSSRFIYRHFPLTQIHKNGFAAAGASEAASNQGKFWEMYGLLFQNQTKWSDLVNPTDTFVDYARTLGIDETQFRKDLSSGAVKGRVERDMVSGNALGVNATPTFLLNGKRIQPRSLDEFRNFLIAAGATANAVAQ